MKRIIREHWGTCGCGKEIYRYTLENASGASVVLGSVGAAIVGVNVPDREGIRIHRGTIPEHSTGCILTDMTGQTMLDVLFNRIENYFSDEETEITIIDPVGA